MSAGKNFSQRLSQRQPRHFFCWEEFTLARARQGFYAGQVEAPMPGRNVLESTSGTCAFEVPRNWKQAPTIFWLLPAWSSELETGMSHFFGVAPRGVSRGVSLNPGTTGLKEAILEFFSWESLGAGSAGLRCRAGSPKLSDETTVSKKKSWEESRPWAWQGSDAGQARPGGRNVAR